jgi:hypothetical protein
VDAGDAAALADQICEVIDQPMLAARVGEAARAEAHARYSFDRMVAAFERLYVAELARRGVAASPAPQLAAS